VTQVYHTISVARSKMKINMTCVIEEEVLTFVSDENCQIMARNAGKSRIRYPSDLDTEKFSWKKNKVLLLLN
jgi:hypothetical protein